MSTHIGAIVACLALLAEFFERISRNGLTLILISPYLIIWDTSIILHFLPFVKPYWAQNVEVFFDIFENSTISAKISLHRIAQRDCILFIILRRRLRNLSIKRSLRNPTQRNNLLHAMRLRLIELHRPRHGLFVCRWSAAYPAPRPSRR